MHRSDGTNIAVGALLVGIGAVILGLLAPVAATVVGAVCAVAGLYLIVGVYRGWRLLPTTATERLFRPNLTLTQALVRKAESLYLVLQIAVYNSGRDDVMGAMVNVIVPDFVGGMVRSSPEGDALPEPDGGRLWREDECFWSGSIAFRGRTVSKIFFRIEPPALNDFPVRLKIYGPALDEPFEERFDASVAEFRRRAGLPGTERAPAPSEQGS